jgi:hypothetical protein
MKKKYKMKIPPHLMREQLRTHAVRQASQMTRWGWRPTKTDLADLRQSTKDVIAYRCLFKAWRRAGFKVRTIQKFAGRSPRNRETVTRQLTATQATRQQTCLPI